MKRVVVVGAGSAGCVVAAELGGGCEVLLVEAGSDRTPESRPARLRSIAYMDALDEPAAFWSGVVASFRRGEAPRDYLRGRGIGGSGAVNAMIGLPGIAADYDRWRDRYGCTGWGWDDVAPTFAELFPTLRQVREDELTVVDRALRDAAADLGMPDDVDLRFDEQDGAGRLWLTADDAGRRSSAEQFLDGARADGRVTVRDDATVVALECRGPQVTGVRLSDGSRIDADHVVLCAGAFGSPEILMRSGISRPGLGRNLKDHAAIRVDLVLHADAPAEDRSIPTIGSVLRTSSGRTPSDIHLLPMHGSLAGAPEGAAGVLVMSLMTATSSGGLGLDDATGRLAIDLDLINTDDDKQAFLAGLQILGEVLATPAFEKTVERVEAGTGATFDRLRSEEFVDTWLEGRLGNYLHPVGTCRMGDPADDGAVVDLHGSVIGYDGVSVIDASVLPDIPAANTHLPTVMVAKRLARHVADQLSG